MLQRGKTLIPLLIGLLGLQIFLGLARPQQLPVPQESSQLSSLFFSVPDRHPGMAEAGQPVLLNWFRVENRKESQSFSWSGKVIPTIRFFRWKSINQTLRHNIGPSQGLYFIVPLFIQLERLRN